MHNQVKSCFKMVISRKFKPGSINFFYQISVVLKSALLPILISGMSPEHFATYLLMIAFGFLYYCIADFGTFAAVSNRLARGDKVPVLSLIFPCVGSISIFMFSQQLSYFIKISEHLIFPFLIYYVTASSFSYLSGNKRAHGKYNDYLKISGILNILEFLIFLAFVYISVTFSTIIVLISICRIIFLVYSTDILRSHNLSFEVKFNLFATNLGLAGVTNTFNQQGALLLLNAFGLVAEMSSLYFLRLTLRPVPLVLRYLSDRSLSEYGALPYKKALGYIQTYFWKSKPYFVGYLIAVVLGCVAVSIYTNNWLISIIMLFLSIEMFFNVLRTPHEIALLNFENTTFKGLDYLLSYNTGLLFLFLFWIDEPRSLYLVLSTAVSSFAVFLRVRGMSNSVLINSK
jgi:hypothetical protein